MLEEIDAEPLDLSLAIPFNTRKNASPGLWLVILVPLACCPGLYYVHSDCHPSPCILSILALQVGISSFHVLQEIITKKGKLASFGFFAKAKNKLGSLLLHQYLPPLLSIFVLSVIYDTNVCVAFCCCFLCHFLYARLSEWIIFNFASSFSFGEGLLVGQASSLVLTLSAKGIFTLPKFFLEHQQISCFIQSAVLVSSALVALIWLFHRRLSLALLVFFLILMGCIGIGVSSLLLGEWSIMWLYLILTSSPTRLALLGWWANITIVILVATNVVQRYVKLPQTIVRKIYHLLLVLVLIPGIVLDPLFTYLACTASTILFILLELIRAIGIEPLSSFLTGTFAFFVDEKDSGTLVLSHIYLLTGLATPLWLYPCNFSHSMHVNNYGNHSTSEDNNMAPPPTLALLSGILSVGIGDTMASIGGTYVGCHRWPGTKKTVEGSLFGVASQILFVGFLIVIGSLNMNWNSWPKFIVSTIICSAVEAFTDQVDNIVLPLLLYTPLVEP